MEEVEVEAEHRLDHKVHLGHQGRLVHQNLQDHLDHQVHQAYVVYDVHRIHYHPLHHLVHDSDQNHHYVYTYQVLQQQSYRMFEQVTVDDVEHLMR